MKSQILKLTMACLALTLCLMSCDKSTNLLEEGDLQQSEMPTMDDSDIDLSAVAEYPSTLIATIQKDGHEIQFSTTGPPESQGIFMEEQLYGSALGNENFITGVNEESTPFDIFLAMTDKEVAIPKSIAASAKDNQLKLSGRQVQKSSEILNLLDENYIEPEEADTELRFCTVAGINCYPSYSWNIGTCDLSAKTYQSSKYSYYNGWKKVKKIYARISHQCGSVSIYFYSWNRTHNKWTQNRRISIPANSGKNRTFSHWVPNLTERKVTYVPHGSKYRNTTQFVK